MDAWLSELEMEHIDKLNEDISAVLGDDFYFTNFHGEPTTQNPTNFLYSTTSIEPIVTYDLQIQDQPPNVNNTGGKNCSGVSIVNDELSPKISERKKRRNPDLVPGHIMAERKRREVLSRHFIALSAMIPGLKKIKRQFWRRHLKHMQEKVKVLEEATSKQVTETIRVVKRKQLVMNKDNESVTENVNGSITSSGRDDDNHQRNELPEIEVKLTPKTVLLKICCLRSKGILGKIFQEVEIRGMIVLNSNVMPLGSSTLDITILAKVEKAEGNDKQVKDLLRTLHSTL